jgi:hypothetical protein
MLLQELPQRRDEMPSMRNIVPANRRANVIFEDAPKPLGSVLGLKQGRAKSRRERVRDVLVLGDCVNLVSRQVTQTDQVVETDHGASPCNYPRVPGVAGKCALPLSVARFV